MKNSQEATRHSDNSKGATRRNFIKIVLVAIGGVGVIEFLVFCFSFFTPHKAASKQSADSNIIEAGIVDTFTVDSVTAFIQGQFYLARLSDGGFLAVSSRCTHLGCSLPWDAGKNQFVCPCHASKFDITGNVLSSPATRPLDMYHVKIINRTIYIDISKKIRRKIFSKSQITYPENVKTLASN